MLRRRSRARTPDVAVPDLSPRWRPRVAEVLDARDRFRRLVARAGDGAVQVRLEGLAAQIDAAVATSIEVATRAQRLEGVVAELGPERLAAALKTARRRLEGDPDDELLTAEVRSLAAQHAAANRLWNELDDCERRLRLIDLRLDEAVARAADVVLGGGGALAVADHVDAELRSVVEDLGHLRAALDEVG